MKSCFSDCFSVSWRGTEWNACKTTDGKCGKGTQERNLKCWKAFNSTTSVVDDSECWKILSEKPETSRPCLLTCPNGLLKSNIRFCILYLKTVWLLNGDSGLSVINTALSVGQENDRFSGPQLPAKNVNLS